MLVLEYAPGDKECVYKAETKSELAALLQPHICSSCLDDAGLIEHHGSLEELLATACGCEWWLTDEKGEQVFLDEWI